MYTNQNTTKEKRIIAKIPAKKHLLAVNQNRVWVIRIPVLLLASSQDWICNLLMIYKVPWKFPSSTRNTWRGPEDISAETFWI